HAFLATGHRRGTHGPAVLTQTSPAARGQGVTYRPSGARPDVNVLEYPCGPERLRSAAAATAPDHWPASQARPALRRHPTPDAPGGRYRLRSELPCNVCRL